MNMQMHLVTGGARSGKSRYAERLASDLARSAHANVTYIATAQAGDDEMRLRIDLHRRRRPREWVTVEAPRHAARAVLKATTSVVLLDCLTLLAANAFLEASDDFARAGSAVQAEIAALIGAADQRTGDLIVVTNEVGFGIVPDNTCGRWFRDLLGEANCAAAGRAEHVTLVVAGYDLHLKG